eukprot:4045015-Pleurochrysis_carterae.AAC.5
MQNVLREAALGYEHTSHEQTSLRTEAGVRSAVWKGMALSNDTTCENFTWARRNNAVALFMGSTVALRVRRDITLTVTTVPVLIIGGLNIRFVDAQLYHAHVSAHLPLRL